MIRCFRPKEPRCKHWMFINGYSHGFYIGPAISNHTNIQDLGVVAGRGDTEITVSELATDFADHPEVVAEIWRRVEEAEGCRCYQDKIRFIYVVIGDCHIHGWPFSPYFEADSGTRGYEAGGYHRLSLAKVLSAVKDNAPVTRQILEFVGAGETPDESVAQAESAVRTLQRDGYTYHGGEFWKPPLGPNAAPLLDRIDELEAKLESAVEPPVKDESSADEELREYMFLARDKCMSHSMDGISEQEAAWFAHGLMVGLKCDVDVYAKIGTVKHE